MLDSAVKFGRMSKKQRDQLYIEVIRHQNSVLPAVHHHHQHHHQNQNQNQSPVHHQTPTNEIPAHYLAQYANITPIQYMQHGMTHQFNPNVHFQQQLQAVQANQAAHSGFVKQENIPEIPTPVFPPYETHPLANAQSGISHHDSFNYES